MNQIATIDEKPRRAIIEVQDPIPLLDTAQFEHMQRIAKVMAQSTLIPEALYMEGPKDKKEILPYEQILSNCFLVVNQAVRWGMDPFAVAQCVSVVHGKLCYEGKLVSAVLDAKLHVRLHHHFTGAGEDMRIYLSDREFDAEIIAELKPGHRKPGWRLFDGSVGEWKTTGNGTPWTAKNFVRMLIYRGTRDWTRIYEPAIMLGVYTPDEMMDLSENVRALRARDVSERPSLADRLSAARTEPQQQPEGFDPSFVARETSALAGGAAIDQNTSSAVSSDDAGGADTADGGVGDAGAPTNLNAALTESSGATDTDTATTAGEVGASPAVDDGPAAGAAQHDAAGSPAPHSLSDDDRAWLLRAAKMLIPSAEPNGDPDVVRRQYAGLLKSETPVGISQLAIAKAVSISKHLVAVCEATVELDMDLLAGIAGCERKDLA